MENKKQTFSILFYIRTAITNNNGEAPIYTRITVDGVRSEFSISRAIHKKRWDSSAQKVKGNQEDARTLNNYINTVKNKLYEHHSMLVQNNKLVTATAIRNAYLGISEKKLKLVELFKYHNQQIKEKIGIDYAKATTIRYETTLNHIINFLDYNYKTSDIYLTDLNHKFITDLEHYFKTVLKCNHNSTIKYIRNVRKVVNIALANDWLQKDPFVKFKASLQEVERDILMQEELKSIEEKCFSINRLDEVRDIFVFCCYTGLSYADVQKLSPDQIVKGIDRQKWIYTHRTKTETKSNIPLLPKALEIIEKYKNHPACAISGKLLPVRSNQKMNAYLKEIADLCGITKNLNFHQARHVAATTVWLTNGVPIESVSSMLGHKNIHTTQIYAKVVEKKVSEDMQMLKNRLLNRANVKSKVS